MRAAELWTRLTPGDLMLIHRWLLTSSDDRLRVPVTTPPVFMLEGPTEPSWETVTVLRTSVAFAAAGEPAWVVPIAMDEASGYPLVFGHPIPRRDWDRLQTDHQMKGR